MWRPSQDILRAAARWMLVLGPAAGSLLVFAYVYWGAYEYWDAHPGRGRWPTCWPAGRTRLVLLMFAVPIWAACMAVVTTVWGIVLAATRTARERAQASGYTLLRAPFGADGNVELAPLAMDVDSGDEYDDDGNGEADGYGRGHRQSAADAADYNYRNRALPPPPATRRWACRPRVWHFALAFYLAVVAFGIYLYETYEQPDDIKYRSLLQRALKNPRGSGYHTGEKYFIAANFYNNERVLPYWTREMSKVITYLGTDNVYVSIYESYSRDKTPEMLEEFSQTLRNMNVKHTLVIRDQSIKKPSPMYTNNARIVFLSSVRNKAMEPLYKMGGFDRVLFSNDVYVEAESVIALLKARNGDWDQVCALDFNVWGLYDAWVIRDRLGGLVSSRWPYLIEEVGARAVEHGQPAPVFSCWNGITALRAEPFYSPEMRRNHSSKLSKEELKPPLPPTHPQYEPWAHIPPLEAPALRFRPSAGKECFSSECFLISYDFRRQFLLDKIYVVPNVLVAYDWDIYVWFKWITRHWLVKWWIEQVEHGDGYQRTRVTMGPKERVYLWDGGSCFSF
ncbi:hypothetical protein AURDEDRAFT_109884 [Auricularia subglabra TFB-10046 SS5]|nr:hypothetical protein AURDEDRAFT_109884 [Auricularia subglabra TFB-10046 SS5]